MIVAAVLGYIAIGLVVLVWANRQQSFDRGDEVILWIIVLAWPLFFIVCLYTWLAETFRGLLETLTWPLIKICVWTRRRP